jgi:hypothetical protein
MSCLSLPVTLFDLLNIDIETLLSIPLLQTRKCLILLLCDVTHVTSAASHTYEHINTLTNEKVPC